MSNAPIIFDETIINKYPQFYPYLKNIRNAIAGTLLPISDTVPYKNKSGQSLGTPDFRWLSFDEVLFDRQIYINTDSSSNTTITFSGNYNSAYICLGGSFQNSTQRGFISFRFHNNTIAKINHISINRTPSGNNFVSLDAEILLKTGVVSALNIPIPNPIMTAYIPYGAVSNLSIIIPANFSS